MSDFYFTPHCDAAAHHLFTCEYCLECPDSGYCFTEENWAKLLQEFPEYAEDIQDEDRDW